MMPSFHTYISDLKNSGADEAFVETIARLAKPLFDRQLPIILSVRDLMALADCSHKYLMRIVGRHVDPYKVYSIRKRQGGSRAICVPEPILRDMQRWIHQHILCSRYAMSRLTGASTAYMPGSSHIDNAKRHRGAQWLIKLDVRRFFESITERQVYYVFRELGYRSLVAFYLSRICTRTLPFDIDRKRMHASKRWRTKERHKFLHSSIVGHLPQGAPTSPMLANYVCVRLDGVLSSMAERQQLIYTRYADDLVFSGSIKNREEGQKIVKLVTVVLGEHGFGINLQKTSIATNGSRKIVTGLSVENNKLRLPRSYKDRLRQELHYLERYGLEDHCMRIGYKNSLSYLLRLDGRIRYVQHIERKLGSGMRERLTQMFPDLDKMKDVILG